MRPCVLTWRFDEVGCVVNVSSSNFDRTPSCRNHRCRLFVVRLARPGYYYWRPLPNIMFILDACQKKPALSWLSLRNSSAPSRILKIKLRTRFGLYRLVFASKHQRSRSTDEHVGYSPSVDENQMTLLSSYSPNNESTRRRRVLVCVPCAG